MFLTNHHLHLITIAYLIIIIGMAVYLLNIKMSTREKAIRLLILFFVPVLGPLVILIDFIYRLIKNSRYQDPLEG